MQPQKSIGLDRHLKMRVGAGGLPIGLPLTMKKAEWSGSKEFFFLRREMLKGEERPKMEQGLNERAEISSVN